MYLEIDEGFIEHPKTFRFCVTLNDPEAWSHLIRLWRWACRACKSGSLAGMRPGEVELAMGWGMRDGRCVAAAIEAGFVEADGSGNPSAIHDWMDYTGGAIARMEAQAAEKKMYRQHKKRLCDGIGGGCVFCMRDSRSAGLRANRRPRTVDRPAIDGRMDVRHRPDQTRPDQTSPDNADQSGGSGSDARVATADPSPGAGGAAAPWRSGHGWWEAFRAAYFTAKGRHYGNGGDGKQYAMLEAEVLAMLPEEEVRALWERRQEIFARYFALQDERVRAGRWPFAMFVYRFNDCRPDISGAPAERLSQPLFDPAKAFPK